MVRKTYIQDYPDIPPEFPDNNAFKENTAATNFD